MSASLNCSFLVCFSSFVIMADMPTSPARTLIDVEKVGMLLLSHLRCRFQVLKLFLGRFLARKGELATTGAVRSAVAPQRSPLRQTLYVPFSHPGIAQRSTTHRVSGIKCSHRPEWRVGYRRQIKLVKPLVYIQPPDIVEKDEESFDWSISSHKVGVYNFRLGTGRVNEYTLLLRDHKPPEFNTVCDPTKHLVLQVSKFPRVGTNFDHEVGT